LGVPPGPLYGQLKAGQDITLPNGKTVLASDVCSPDDPGPVFVVVECPDETYLDNFVSEPQLCQLQRRNGASELDSPQIIVHFTPVEVRFPEKKTFSVSVIKTFILFFPLLVDETSEISRMDGRFFGDYMSFDAWNAQRWRRKARIW
jgi:hypothetical protein